MENKYLIPRKKNDKFLFINQRVRTLLWVILILAFNSQSIYSQILQSSCSTTDSVKNIFRKQADQLVVRRMNLPNSPYNDSVLISSKKSDSVLNSLISVYNLQNLPVLDTIRLFQGFRILQSFELREFIISANNNVPWMGELSSGTIPTGNAEIDSILLEYNLKFKDYFGSSGTDYVLLGSLKNVNINAICNKFNSISSVISCEPNGIFGDGNDITDTLYSDHDLLTYSIGWDDCISGCTKRRYWQFKCYDSCKVEFKRSYGDNLTFVGLNNTRKEPILVSPNPFTNYISIAGVQPPFEYAISTIYGQVIVENTCYTNNIESLDFIPNGVYFLSIKNNSDWFSTKIVRTR